MRSTSVYLIVAFLWITASVHSAAAQAGGPYDLSRSVIAGGGGSQSTGGTFKVDGTVGQNLAGTRIAGGGYGLRGGFWGPRALSPTAAGVSISGQIRTMEGRGISSVRVTLTNPATGESFAALSSSFGYYLFEEIPVGQIYILSVSSKRYTFDPAIRLLNLLDEITGEDFIALPT